MTTPPILLGLIILPLLGLLLLVPISSSRFEAVRKKSFQVGLMFSGLNFFFSLILLYNFDPNVTGFQLVQRFPEDAPIGYALGVDGISVPLILLTAFIVPLCFIFDWNKDVVRPKEYVGSFLMMEALMIGVFTSIDWLSFYVFFELSLVPMFIIIGVWGGKERVYAAFKFFLYTLLGSIPMIFAMAYVLVVYESTYLPDLFSTDMPREVQRLLWLALFAGFAVKIPLFPFHTWLPAAHVQAPASGSVILAAILLKIGGYGLIRFCLQMLPEVSVELRYIPIILSLIGIVYGSLLALAQKDMKKMIAYSSVAHMGFVPLGIFAFSSEGVSGAMFQMISHGLISGGLFFAVGIIYAQRRDRDISSYGGLASVMPRYSVLFLALIMGSVALPGTSGFVGEFLVILANISNLMIAALAATGVILSATYMLYLGRKVLFGKSDISSAGMDDLSFEEFMVMGSLVTGMVLLGIFPNLVLFLMDSTILEIVRFIAPEGVSG